MVGRSILYLGMFLHYYCGMICLAPILSVDAFSPRLSSSSPHRRDVVTSVQMQLQRHDTVKDMLSGRQQRHDDNDDDSNAAKAQQHRWLANALVATAFTLAITTTTTMAVVPNSVAWAIDPETTTVVAVPRAPDLNNGAALFEANCATCHAGGMNFVAEKKTLTKEALERFRSLEQKDLEWFVQKGIPHRFLPFQFEDEKDYYDVTSYVLDQALGEKWQNEK